MTSPIKRIAGVLTVLEGAWLLYSSFSGVETMCPLNGCPGPTFSPLFSQGLLALGVILLIDGLLGVWGAWFAFPLGSALSAIFLVVGAYAYWLDNSYTYLTALLWQDAVGSVLALVALAANVAAVRTKSRLSEQANPMNLPVFG
jgi:hypothetical protein